MLGNGWSELVAFWCVFEYLYVLGLVRLGFRCITVLAGRAYVVPVAGILTTGCILGLDLVRWFSELSRVLFMHGPP